MLRACKQCGKVGEDVETYRNELNWQGPPKPLCVECQKRAFEVQVKLIILGSISALVTDGYREREAEKVVRRVVEFAKVNRITEDYAVKLVKREVALLRVRL